MDQLSQVAAGRVALVGVGRIDRGDDGFGPRLARALSECAGIDVLDCGDWPEDFTADILRSDPDTVLIADAVEMGATPGEVALVRAPDLSPGCGGTHRASLRALMEYLEWRGGARVLLLAVQPGSISDRPELSPAVAASVDRLAAMFERVADVKRRAETRS